MKKNSEEKFFILGAAEAAIFMMNELSNKLEKETLNNLFMSVVCHANDVAGEKIKSIDDYSKSKGIKSVAEKLASSLVKPAYAVTDKKVLGEQIFNPTTNKFEYGTPYETSLREK